MAAVLLLSLLSLQQGLLVAADAHAPLVTPAPRLLARQAGGEDPAFGFCEETKVDECYSSKGVFSLMSDCEDMAHADEDFYDSPAYTTSCACKQYSVIDVCISSVCGDAPVENTAASFYISYYSSYASSCAANGAFGEPTTTGASAEPTSSGPAASEPTSSDGDSEPSGSPTTGEDSSAPASGSPSSAATALKAASGLGLGAGSAMVALWGGLGLAAFIFNAAA